MSRHVRIRCCRLETEGTLPIVCPSCSRVHWRDDSGAGMTALEKDAFDSGFFAGVSVSAFVVAVVILALVAIGGHP